MASSSQPEDAQSQDTDHALPIKSAFSDTIVTVLVGPREVKWSLHENMLASRSSFLEAAFRGGWKEGEEGILRLPEDSPRVFELFVGVSPRHSLAASSSHFLLAC